MIYFKKLFYAPKIRDRNFAKRRQVAWHEFIGKVISNEEKILVQGGIMLELNESKYREQRFEPIDIRKFIISKE